MNRRIVFAQYNNPAAFPPLLHSTRILAEEGWQVLVLGIEDKATRALEFPTQPRITVKRLSFCPLGWRRNFYFLFFTFWVCAWAVRWRARWVYASDLFATPAAWLVSFFPSARVCYHEHDTPTASRGFAKFWIWTRARVARRAAMCVLPSAERAKNFAQQFDVASKTICVWNCPERGEVDAGNTGATWDAEGGITPPLRDVFRVLYHGSITPAHLPLVVLDALAQLPEKVNLRVVGYETVGHAGYMQLFLESARALNLAGRVEWLGAAPRAELLALASGCEVGLALMPLGSDEWNERAMAGASNKAFDYMARGLGLVVSDLPDWRALFVENHFARVCDPRDAQSIANALRWFFEHPDARRAMGAAAQEKIRDEWNYETQFAPVLNALNTGIDE